MFTPMTLRRSRQITLSEATAGCVRKNPLRQGVRRICVSGRRFLYNKGSRFRVALLGSGYKYSYKSRR